MKLGMDDKMARRRVFVPSRAIKKNINLSHMMAHGFCTFFLISFHWFHWVLG